MVCFVALLFSVDSAWCIHSFLADGYSVLNFYSVPHITAGFLVLNLHRSRVCYCIPTVYLINNVNAMLVYFKKHKKRAVWVQSYLLNLLYKVEKS